MKAWARIDAFAPKSGKIICLSSDPVRWTWLLVLCDGKIQKPQGQWMNTEHLAGSINRPRKHIDELIKARLIDQAEDGSLTAHNWDLWQSSSHDDPTKQERQRRYREARREELAEEERSRRRTRGDGSQRRRGDGVATDHGDGQTETETETETESNTPDSSEPPEDRRSEPPGAIALDGFPCVGPSKTWALREALVAQLAEAFPHLDILAEAQRAKAWLFANAERRKTARGMPRFLNSWLARVQDSARAGPRNGTPAKPAPGRPRGFDGIQEAARRMGVNLGDLGGDSTAGGLRVGELAARPGGSGDRAGVGAPVRALPDRTPQRGGVPGGRDE